MKTEIKKCELNKVKSELEYEVRDSFRNKYRLISIRVIISKKLRGSINFVGVLKARQIMRIKRQLAIKSKIVYV